RQHGAIRPRRGTRWWPRLSHANHRPQAAGPQSAPPNTPSPVPRRSLTVAKARNDFTDVLVRRKIISPDQLTEAENSANSTGVKLQDALVKLEYVTQQEVMSAIAEFNNLQYIDMTNLEIPKSVIELVPESVARENVVIPLAIEGNVLKIITADPSNYETLQKLQFIL